jgi:hypothetical protein
VGGYPSEYLIVAAFKTHQTYGLQWSFWLYAVLMLIIAAVSIMVQLEHRKRNLDLYSYSQKFENIRYIDFRTMRNQAIMAKGERQLRAELQ